jgi:acetoin utilization deacetylase AcuC-like enzyme
VSLFRRARRLFHRSSLPIWYDPSYRLPLSALESATGNDPRRADMVLSHLLAEHIVEKRDIRNPTRIRYEDLARVHSEDFLESLQSPKTIADVFGVDPVDVIVDEVLNTVRLACGGTLQAARAALSARTSTLNLLGGFHHAGPRRGGGFCLLNDIAVATAVVRAEGFKQRVVVLDLDAHPPDGTAECFAGDPTTWIGSLSGSDWGKLDAVDETVLPRDCDDRSYLAALDALLSRMPPAGLAFVIAGGDVLAGDRFGALALTLDGARERDLTLARALERVPSVWLPGGGYTPQAWKVLAGSAMALASGSREPIRTRADPMLVEFARVAGELSRDRLEGWGEVKERDLIADLDRGAARSGRLLGFYTAEGIEYAFARYGILRQLRRLGYGNFRITIDDDTRGDRLRLFAQAEGHEHLLIECVLELQPLFEARVLYVHWLTLRNPRGRFSDKRPRLPGQEEPGLGLAREAFMLFERIARRLDLAGVAYRPAFFHTAYPAREVMRFVDPARQGRFEALLRDVGARPLLEVSHAISQGKVLLDGAPYTWEADEMVYWLDDRPADREAIEAEKKRVHFQWT